MIDVIKFWTWGYCHQYKKWICKKYEQLEKSFMEIRNNNRPRMGHWRTPRPIRVLTIKVHILLPACSIWFKPAACNDTHAHLSSNMLWLKNEITVLLSSRLSQICSFVYARKAFLKWGEYIIIRPHTLFYWAEIFQEILKYCKTYIC